MCKSRATCVPLQYPSSATRGVKQGLSSNKKPSKQNLIVVSTLLQERNNNTDEVLSDPLIKESSFTTPESKTESGMYYELSNKRRMECERYQDCSWFRQDIMKEDLNTKLSLGETAEAIINTNEFDLAMQMQFANAHTIPWGDEYLEVFDNDILLEVNDMGEKNKTILSPPNENFSNANFKTGEDSVYNTNNINYSLRKTDSFDSMKNISSTNPAEIIPISYKEKINNSNYSLTKVEEIKSEVKEEMEVRSPESEMFLLDSDDTDLNIGREEIVIEGNANDDHQQETNKKEKFGRDSKVFSAVPSNADVLSAKEASDSKIQESGLTKYEFPAIIRENQTMPLPIKMECNDSKKQNGDEKLDLNLDLTKGNFEESVVDVNTPDLDFMDLVDFINEEMHPASENAVVIPSLQTSKTGVGSSSTQNQDQSHRINVEAFTPSQTSPASDRSDRSILKSSNNFSSVNSNENSTVNLNDISEKCISIAERIKTGAKRRTLKKYELRDTDVFEDEDDENFGSEDEDDDDDYDYKEDLCSRRGEPIRKRSKSTTSESSSCSKKQRSDFGEGDTYRERRDKNNEASRRSRQNRKDRELRMFKTLEEQERRNVKLKAEAEVLEKQVTSLRQLLLQVVLRKGGPT